VPIIPGALQVFSGMLLSRWTDGLLAARPPPGSPAAGDRRSSAVFVPPQPDTVVEPLERFFGPDGPESNRSVWTSVRTGSSGTCRLRPPGAGSRLAQADATWPPERAKPAARLTSAPHSTATGPGRRLAHGH